MEKHQINGQVLCGWSHCHSIPSFWSDNQHCLQGGHLIPCHDWRNLALHIPKLHKNVFSCIGKENEMGNCKHIYYVFRFLCKMDYNTNEFICAPT